MGTRLEILEGLESAFFLRFEMTFLWGKKDEGSLAEEFSGEGRLCMALLRIQFGTPGSKRAPKPVPSL